VALRIIVPTAFIVLLLAGLYYPVVSHLLDSWQANPDYSHGFFVPLIVGYMVYRRWGELKGIACEPNNWGIVILLLGLIQLTLGIIGAEHFLQSTSLIVVAFGIILFLAGLKMARTMTVPLLYLMFMIPLPAIIWNNFAFSLRLAASKIAVTCMHAMGMTVLREGNMIYLPTASLEVVDACSGMRYLVSLMALGALFAFMSNYSTWKKWTLFLSSIPIAIVSNIVRLVVVVLMVQAYGEDAALGVTHTFSGIIVFFIGLVLLLLMNKLLLIHPRKFVRELVNRHD